MTTKSISELLKLARELKAAKAASLPVPTPLPAPAEKLQGTGKSGNLITYNEAQARFISLVASGKSCVLIGAAGTGKTTCMQGTLSALIQEGKIPTLPQSVVHKHLQSGIPGIVACSYTRRAVSNLRKAMPLGMEGNAITIHKALEYQPVYYTVWDSSSQKDVCTMRFEPSRTVDFPLPTEIKVVTIDESSMVSVELWKELLSACTPHTQFIFLGDINQLPPVFGSAILGFKMLELPVIELTEVYRQALESPIIEYATRIRKGEGFFLTEKLVKETSQGKVSFHPWKKRISSDAALATFAKFITLAYDTGAYSPVSDMILCPFNKAFGTIEINKHIANHIAKREGKIVWEIITGFQKIYLSVGDKVLYDKEDARILSIEVNPAYSGKQPQPESNTLDYWGAYSDSTYTTGSVDVSVDSIDMMLDAMAANTGERVRESSHRVILMLEDSENEVTISSAADLNSLILSYSLTVHKSQGSEWDKVFVVLHSSHAVMIQRELLYTAVTRAAKELYVICESDTFVKGVASQRIKGNTLEEKAEWFKGKLDKSGGSY